MKRPSHIDGLNALAAQVSPATFRLAGATDCVTYALAYNGPPVHWLRYWRGYPIDINPGTIIYAGEGLPVRATMQFKRRGKVAGLAGRDLDDFIAYGWPHFSAYYAASNVTKAVARELEGLLIREFHPPFNDLPPRSSSAPLSDIDAFPMMRSAELLDFPFGVPPAGSHGDRWRANKIQVRPQRWVEISGDYILTRTSLRQKNNTPDATPHEIAHYNCYPPSLGEQTTVKAHRKKAAEARQRLRDWEIVKSILWWDVTYDDPIITITPAPNPQ